MNMMMKKAGWEVGGASCLDVGLLLLLGGCGGKPRLAISLLLPPLTSSLMNCAKKDIHLKGKVRQFFYQLKICITPKLDYYLKFQ